MRHGNKQSFFFVLVAPFVVKKGLTTKDTKEHGETLRRKVKLQESLDNDYLETTAEQLGVKPILDELRAIAESYDLNVTL